MQNKKARFNYELIETYTAGIMLNGDEVKSIRDNKMSFIDSYCIIDKNRIVLKKFHISIKDKNEDECLRDRTLLLNKKEILKIEKKIKEKGLTLIPVSIFFTNTGLIKLDISLAKGKKLFNKKETIKERDLKRQVNE